MFGPSRPIAAASDAWRIGRRAALAGLGLAGLTGYLARGEASSDSRTVPGGSPSGNVLSVLDFVPQAERQAIRAGTPTRDAAVFVREAIRRLGDNSVLVFPPGLYPMDELIDDPMLQRPFASAYFEGLSNVAVLGYGATLRRTAAVRSTGAVLVFRACKRVSVHGLHYVAPPSRGGQDSGSLTNFFACEGVDVHASIDGGRAIAQFTSADGGMDPAGATSDTLVVGDARNSHYGISYYHPLGENHHVQLRASNVVRSLIVTGVRRLSGRITSDRGTSDLLFIGRHGDPIRDVNLDYATRRPSSHAIRLEVRDPTAPMAYERMRIAGSICDSTKASVSIEAVGSDRTFIDGLDFSDLKIVGSRSHGVLIAPDAPATIRNIAIGDVSAEGSAVLIDNSAKAAITAVRVVGKTLSSRSSAAVDSRNGDVGDILLLGCDFNSAPGAPAVTIRNARSVRIDQCVHDGRLDLQGCEYVAPAVANHRRGSVAGVADALEQDMSVLFINLVRVSAAGPTVTGLRDAAPGQRLLILGLEGGGGRLEPSARLRLQRRFEIREGHSLELVCSETTSRGESVFREVARHDRDV